MAKVIGICNSKGGVGKTTTTDAMGAGLVKLGKKVLIVDADDSNPSLSKVHGFYDEQMTITDLMLFTSCGRLRKEFLDEIIKTTDEGVDIIPNDEKLPNITAALNASKDDAVRFGTMKQIIDMLREQYDYILIDTAPATNTMTLNVLAAVDEVLIVSQAQDMGDVAIEVLLSNVIETKKTRNAGIKFSGLLLTMVSNLKGSQKKAQEMTDKFTGYGVKVFQSVIPRGGSAEKFSESGKSILGYRPFSPAAKAYRSFVREYLESEE